MNSLKKLVPALARGFASSPKADKKVAVIGAAGGIGQPLSMLMKMNPMVSKLSLYDVMGTPGVAADISHMNTPAVTKGFMGDEQLHEAVSGCDLIIIPAGVPRKPGMTRDDLFKINAGIVKSLSLIIAKNAPNAVVAMISNPVNSTVPICAEVMKAAGVYHKGKILGVTTLDIVRAKTFYAEKAGVDVTTVDVPVIGGHAGVTILPLFSQATPKATLAHDVLVALTKRTQDGGTEVVEAKAGKGSATLSMAYAGAHFGDAVLRGLSGQAGVVECTYLASDLVPGLSFFSSKCVLGRNGAEAPTGYGTLSAFEKEGLEALKKELAESIQKGVDFARSG